MRAVAAVLVADVYYSYDIIKINIKRAPISTGYWCSFVNIIKLRQAAALCEHTIYTR